MLPLTRDSHLVFPRHEFLHVRVTYLTGLGAIAGGTLPGWMDELTDDELLAQAIADVAFDVLDRLADKPDRRSEFLLAVLRLAVAYGGGDLATDALRDAGH